MVSLGLSNASNVSLYHIALQWLSEDREHHRALEKQGKRFRGARRNEVRDAKIKYNTNTDEAISRAFHLIQKYSIESVFICFSVNFRTVL